MKRSRFCRSLCVSVLLVVLFSPLSIRAFPGAVSNEIQVADPDNGDPGTWMDVPAALVVELVHAPVATLVVTSTADSGVGTFRWTLQTAAINDTITFDPSVFPPGSPATILVQSALPKLDQDNVTIDASEAGVIIDGSSLSGDINGLIIEAVNCVIRGLTIQHFPKDGIWIEIGANGNTIGGARNVGAGPNGQGNLIVFNGTTGISIRSDTNRIWGNYIGIDGTGWWDWGNGFNGVAIWDGATGNIVGGDVISRNVISGNDQNGIWIHGSGTNQNVIIGNYVGTRADGMGAVPNTLSGVAIQGGAQRNRVGGAADSEGNVISGNTATGVYISDPGTKDNEVLGNIIGLNWQGTDIIGQGRYGVALVGGASSNQIGDGSDGGRNTISGNSAQGVIIGSGDTVSNTVQGNYVGTNTDGDTRLANREEGVRIDGSAHDNRVQGNVISGNGSGGHGNGIVIVGGAHHNVIRGNFIGTDKTGTFAIGGQPGGGIDLAGGAYSNTIGGPTAAERNIISGNGVDGIFIEGWETMSNTVQGNYIGTNVSGTMPVPNSWGLFILNGAPNTIVTDNLISHNSSHGLHVTYDALSGEIVSNTISHNGGAGVHFEERASLYQVMSNTIKGNGQNGVWVKDNCDRITLTRNSIYDNEGKGIRLDDSANGALSPPKLTVVATDTITGTAVPNARVELFLDDEDEGRVYEGFKIADTGGVFSFTQPGGFVGPNVTVTATDADGNTSEFSQPAHLLWTLLLYLNGDNDLEESIFNTLTNTVAAGPSPRANVLALVDGYTSTAAYSGTVLYDLTWGHATPLTVTSVTTGERNMGDGQTLIDFVTWGRVYSPTYYTMLAIVDHGGGWAPGDEAFTPDTSVLARYDRWSAGSSGLSWDFTSEHDYLDSNEIRQAMATITITGTDPLDVVFYDVCLMGMLEVAYQIEDYASFFVSSQNIGWVPVGPQGRYIRTIQGIEPTTTPQQMAELLVQAYADATPPNNHPFTISAVDLASLSTVAGATDQLATAISQTLTGPDRAVVLNTVYSETQKLDYDTDFYIEPASDGFVDLYDFALHASQQYTDSAVVVAAHAVTTALDTAIVAEQHRSGSPWMALDRVWDLDNVHGLSIFLPLGEDLELVIRVITDSTVITQIVPLRDLYSSDQLQFAENTAWDELIDTYYETVSSPVPTDTTGGPADGLIIPDVTPPQTVITITGAFTVGETITMTWVSTDTQTGVDGAALWYRPFKGQWSSVLTQTGISGAFSFTLSETCLNSFSVRASDVAGNVEPTDSDSNMIIVKVQPCWPELNLDKYAQPVTVEFGERLTYTLAYSNTGNFWAENVVITDTLPLSVTVVFSNPTAYVPDDRTLVWDIDQLDADSTEHIVTVVVTASKTVTGNRWLTNTAAIAGESVVPITASITTWAHPAPDIRLEPPSQSQSFIITSTSPHTVTYPWQLFNRSSFTGVVSFILASSQAWNWHAITPSLPIVLFPQESTYVEITTILSDATEIDRSSVTDALTIGVTSVRSSSLITTAVATTTVLYATDLELAKTAQPPDVKIGERLTYTLKYSNTGNFLAEGVVITDTLPPNVTVVFSHSTAYVPNQRTLVWDVGDLAAGGVPHTKTVVVMATDTITSSQWLTNTATIVGRNTDPATEWVATWVYSTTNLSLEKTAQPPAVKTGERLTYTLTYSNTGNFLAEGVVITDTLPPNVTVVFSHSTAYVPNQRTLVWDVGDLAAGGVPHTKAVVVIATDTITSSRWLTNTATIVGRNTDPATEWVATWVYSTTNLSLEKTAQPPAVKAGERLTYTLTYTNTGNFLAEGVVITDTLPPNVTVVFSHSAAYVLNQRTLVWDVGDLAAGGVPHTKTVVVMATDTITSSRWLTNTATIVGTNTYPVIAWVITEIRFYVYLPITLKNYRPVLDLGASYETEPFSFWRLPTILRPFQTFGALDR